MAENQTAFSRIGHIHIADEVIAVIAGTAASEIDGIILNPGGFGAEFAKKNLARGVKIAVSGGDVKIDVTIGVKMGFKLQEVSEAAQKKIKTATETMTGLNVTEVNVHITSVQTEKPPKKSARTANN